MIKKNYTHFLDEISGITREERVPVYALALTVAAFIFFKVIF